MVMPFSSYDRDRKLYDLIWNHKILRYDIMV